LRRNNSELLQLLEDSVKKGLIDAETLVLKSSIKRRESEAAFAPAAIGFYIGYAGR